MYGKLAVNHKKEYGVSQKYPDFLYSIALFIPVLVVLALLMSFTRAYLNVQWIICTVVRAEHEYAGERCWRCEAKRAGRR